MAPPRANRTNESNSDEDDSPDIGPALPPHLANAGPARDHPLSAVGSSGDDDSSHSDGPSGSRPSAAGQSAANAYGPALPPSLMQKQQMSSRPIVGPSLPPSGSVADYALPSDDDDDVIGPLPPPAGDRSEYDVAREFEKRAERMKQKLTSNVDDGKLKRAEWMLELPPELNKNFGLGPRSFLRQTPAPKGDRSGWTQTPNSGAGGSGDKSEVIAPDDALDKKVVLDLAQAEYNKTMNRRTEDLNKSAKREKSLMEIHQKNLKRKKKKEEPKSKERRPFDRDEDLKANSFDEARRKALIKKSRQLDDKFSCGKSQFL